MLTLTYHGHTLMAVPAIHGRGVFAEMVNRACANPSTRPDAIAVELEPPTVAAVVDWFRELGMGLDRQRLPCMLGLTSPNRWLHPRYRKASIRLQAETGQTLDELPQELLLQELGYAPISLLCLSPTDSIIEAIRCALELDIPVHGIDSEHARCPDRPVCRHMRDPVTARAGLDEYIRRHRRNIEASRDDYTDQRREIVMAARLKGLLNRHERVLFTCGMGHWISILNYLGQPELTPTDHYDAGNTGGYQRVLVHPLQAIQQMDLFPAIAADYETQRQPANRDVIPPSDIDYQARFRERLTTAIQRYTVGDRDSSTRETIAHSHVLTHFTGFLGNLALISQQQTPDLGALIMAARALAPEPFVSILTETFMEFEWASPAAYPDLPLIGPDVRNGKGNTGPSTYCVLKTPQPTRGRGRPDYQTSMAFPVTPHQDAEAQPVEMLVWSWTDEPRSLTEVPMDHGPTFIWPPYENLFYSCLYSAINLADSLEAETQTEPFLDSLGEGIDLKASLRARLKGDQQLYVRCKSKRSKAERTNPSSRPIYNPKLELQPSVMILSKPPDSGKGDWECLMAGDDGIYADFSPSGKKQFDQRFQGKGHFLESIHYAESHPVPSSMQPWVSALRWVHGAVRFGNPCNNFHQATRWLEKGGFDIAPFVPGHLNFHSALSFYQYLRQKSGCLCMNSSDFRGLENPVVD